MVPCGKCKVVCQNYGEFLIHTKEKHGSILTLKCGKCDVEEELRGSMREHFYEKHRDSASSVEFMPFNLASARYLRNQERTCSRERSPKLKKAEERRERSPKEKRERSPKEKRERSPKEKRERSPKLKKTEEKRERSPKEKRERSPKLKKTSEAELELFGSDTEIQVDSDSESDASSTCSDCSRGVKRPYMELCSSVGNDSIVLQVPRPPPNLVRFISKVTVHTSWYSKVGEELKLNKRTVETTYPEQAPSEE